MQGELLRNSTILVPEHAGTLHMDGSSSTGDAGLARTSSRPLAPPLHSDAHPPCMHPHADTRRGWSLLESAM